MIVGLLLTSGGGGGSVWGEGFLPSLSPLEWGGCWRSSASLSQCELPIWQSWEFLLERPLQNAEPALLHSAGSTRGAGFIGQAVTHAHSRLIRLFSHWVEACGMDRTGRLLLMQ